MGRLQLFKFEQQAILRPTMDSLEGAGPMRALEPQFVQHVTRVKFAYQDVCCRCTRSISSRPPAPTTRRSRPLHDGSTGPERVRDTCQRRANH